MWRGDPLADLLLDLEPALRSIARRFPAREFEDLMAVGRAGVWRAHVRGVTERGHLITKARWAMQDHMRVVNPEKRVRARMDVVLLSLDQFREMGVEFAEPVADLPAEIPEEVMRAIHALPPRLRLVVERRLAGKKLDPIAAELGVTQPRVSQMLTEATGLIRRALACA